MRVFPAQAPFPRVLRSRAGRRRPARGWSGRPSPQRRSAGPGAPGKDSSCPCRALHGPSGTSLPPAAPPPASPRPRPTATPAVPWKSTWSPPQTPRPPRPRRASGPARRSRALPLTGPGSAPEPSCSSCLLRTADERYCPDLAEEERRQLRAFSARRRQEALGQGLACPVPGPCHGCPCRKCGRRLNKGDPGVSASRLGDQFWHPSCFSCHFCQQQLVDLIYFQQDGRIYCGRHHAELFRPRCASCDQLIFMEECIEAEGRRWHLEHFCCLECDEPLRGQRYVMRSGRPCCRGCFESLFAEPCQACGDPIGADSEEVTHQGLHWHARPPASAAACAESRCGGQPLACRRGRLFCSDTCSRGQDASSTASSDSSDSAFASAPSPDSTPLSRAGPAGRTSAAGGCRLRGEGAEAFSDQAPVHPAFRSPEDLGAAAKERSSDAAKEHMGTLGPPAGHPSAPQPSPEGPNEPGALDHLLLGGPDPRTAAGNANPHFQAGTSPPRHSPRPEDGTEEDDSWCPTCSSSSDSDSEEEGFFFGKPIPKPGMNSLGREPPGRGRGRTAKHCSVS
ncbi:prickle-like protein 4 isoform X2 [Corvus moneduloides]|nr:prickle-like protein 4 isoform X2 [Corvus moneduloides]XP_031988634.1 prickle-like protein 4 isoform X2 [Corvus moneduloides]